MSTTNKLISILKKEDRSIDEIQFLKVYLCRNKQVFESFKASPEINNEICRAVKYETYPKYSIIFKQGDKNCDKAYIILKGRILIYMKNTIDVFQKETEVQNSNPIDLQTKKCQVELLLENQLKENDDIARNEVPEQDFLTVLGMDYGKLIIEVEEGALFGEKALIENKPRAATICSKTPYYDFHKMMLKVYNCQQREDFEIVQIKYNKTQQDKKDFIMAKFPFLGNLITSARVFERLVRFFDEETYHKNQILVTEGVKVSTENQKLYIIVSGEVQLYRNVTKKIQNPHSLIQHQTEQIHIATLGQSEIFGEELLESDNSNVSYVNTAVCVSSNSQFLTITIQVLEKKMPDQMKDFIQANYQYKKNLRNTILLEHEKQQKEIEVMKKKKTHDQYDVEKHLLTKIKKIQKENEMEISINYKIQQQVHENHLKDFAYLESPQHKISGLNSKDESKIFDFSNYNHATPDEHLSIDCLSNQKSDIQELLQNSKSYKNKFQKQSDQAKPNKSIDSEDLQAVNDDRQQVIKGNSDQQNMFLFHQLRNDLNDKIKKEGGFQKDLNLSFYYEHGLQENNDTLQFQRKKYNPYPFKLTANNKHLKQLETRLKQKKFQFADAQDILSKTKYYQAKEKNEFSLKDMIEEGQAKSQKFQNFNQDKYKKDKAEKQSQVSNKQMITSIMKRSSPSKEQKLENSQIIGNGSQYILKKIGITNLFKDTIRASEYGNKVENAGRNLFACSDKIKLNSILKRISDNYKPHFDYYEDPQEAAQMIEMSKYYSDKQFKYYEQSNINKNLVEVKKVLSRSPIVRRLNIAQQSAQHGGGVSIPSNRRFIIDNDHNVNENYYFYKTSIRPCSDEGRYHSNAKEKRTLKNNKINQIESMVMQSSSQSLGIKNGNTVINNKISVKYMQLQPNQNSSDTLKQNKLQLDNSNTSIQSSSQRLHSNSKKQNSISRTNTIKNKKINDSSNLSSPKKVEFSFFNNEQNQQNSINHSKSKNKHQGSSYTSQSQKESSFSQNSQINKLSNSINGSSHQLSNQTQEIETNSQHSKDEKKLILESNEQSLLVGSNQNIQESQQLVKINSSGRISSSKDDKVDPQMNENKINKEIESNLNNSNLENNQIPINIDDFNNMKKIIDNLEFKQVSSNFEITNPIDQIDNQRNHEKLSEYLEQYKKQNNFQIGQEVESSMLIDEKNQTSSVEQVDIQNPLLESNQKGNLEIQQQGCQEPSIQDLSQQQIQNNDQIEEEDAQKLTKNASHSEKPKLLKKKEATNNLSSSTKKSLKKKQSNTFSKKKSQVTSSENIKSSKTKIKSEGDNSGSSSQI